MHTRSPERRSFASDFGGVSPRLHSPRYSQDVPYSGSVRLAKQRLDDLQFQHERSLKSLQSQIATVRLQIDGLHQDHQFHRQKLREDHEYKLRSLLADSSDRTRALQMQVEEASRRRREAETLQRRVAAAETTHSALNEEVCRLTADVQLLSSQVREAAESQVQRAERERQLLREQHEHKLQTLQSDHRRAVYGLQEDVAHKQGMVAALQQELATLRRQVQEKRGVADKEIYELEQAFQSNLKELTGEQQEHERLKLLRQGAKQENEQLLGEANRLQSEASAVKRQNETLKFQIDKLKKLVYGQQNAKTGSP